MIPGLLTVLSYFHPGIGASNSGDDYNYADIEWSDPGQIIPESQLLAEQIELTKIYKKQELNDVVTSRLESDGMWYQGHHFETSIHKRSIYTLVATSLIANGNVGNFNGCFDMDYNFVSMDYTAFIAFTTQMANYITGLCAWQINGNIAIDALTTAEDVDTYDYMSSMPTNDTDGSGPA